jgi:hypothetical protein
LPFLDTLSLTQNFSKFGFICHPRRK